MLMSLLSFLHSLSQLLYLLADYVFQIVYEIAAYVGDLLFRSDLGDWMILVMLAWFWFFLVRLWLAGIH